MEIAPVSLPSKKMIWSWSKASFKLLPKQDFTQKKHRIISNYAGKLGEFAFRERIGKGQVSFDPTTNSDFDVFTSINKYGVKTKRVKKLPNLMKLVHQYYCHIPKEQYLFIKKTCDTVVFMLVVEGGTNPLEWTPYYVGQIKMDIFDQFKVLHTAGTKLPGGFVLPPPDSYGVVLHRFHFIPKPLTK